MANQKQRPAASGKAQQQNPKLKLWIAGARLRTLPLAVAPVLLGACAPLAVQHFKPLLFWPALAVALLLQIGVNYANDYSDGIRGTDEVRVGPLRLTGSKAVPAAMVKRAAFICFGAAALAGLVIVLLTQYWWLIAVGVACILAAWFYTGGKRPYGYAGLGELAVFIFFGLVATVGTSYIQERTVDQTSVIFGVAAGCFAVAVLLVNNLRDIKQDKLVGKRTLSTRIGAGWTKALFVFNLWLPLAIAVLVSVVYNPAIYGLGVIFLVGPATLILFQAKSPKDLITVLKLSSYASLAFALLELFAFSIQ